jgi:TetR/AcrR family transcriptional regulator, transcriptional repressor for nem operon
MKRSKAETAETRKRIVEAASHLFRRDGIHATGLAEIMTAAGMTHGGFYRHFPSKDQLVAEALGAGSQALRLTVQTVMGGRTGRRAVQALLDNYLAPKHKDHPGDGCPFAAMGAELARADSNTRAAVSGAFVRLADSIAERAPEKKSSVARSDAIFMLCAMIGALTMARAVDDPKLSASILRSAKQHLADS